MTIRQLMLSVAYIAVFLGVLKDENKILSAGHEPSILLLTLVMFPILILYLRAVPDKFLGNKYVIVVFAVIVLITTLVAVFVIGVAQSNLWRNWY